MKKKITLTVITMVAFLCSCVEQPKDVAVAESDRNEIVLFVPHPLPEGQRAPFLEFLEQLLVSRIGLGDTVSIYQATDTVSRVSSITIPTRETYERAPELRLEVLEKEFGEIKQWVMTPDASAEGTLSINIPDALRVAGTLGLSSETDSVLLVGSGIFDHHHDVAWSMMGDDEEHSFVPSASTVGLPPSECPYGTRGLTARLPDGLPVHFLHLEEYALFSAHRRAVESYWALNVASRGGVLRSAEIDPSLILERLPSGYGGTIAPMEANPEGKVEMLIYRPPTRLPASDNAGAPVDVSTSRLGFMTTERTTTEPLNVVQSESIKFGATWQAAPGTDLDIYVLYSPDAKELFFGHNRNADGALHEKDFVSPPGGGALELVDLNGVKVRLADLRVCINNYKSPVSDKPISVEFRMLVDGRVYSKRFTMPANGGNKGRDRKGKRSNDYWHFVDLPRLLGQ